MTTVWVVVCEDGVQRHEPFRDHGDAARWAQWGHACTGTHDITEQVPRIKSQHTRRRTRTP